MEILEDDASFGEWTMRMRRLELADRVGSFDFSKPLAILDATS
jgi:hypothetical protein